MFLTPEILLSWITKFVKPKLTYNSDCIILIKHFEGCRLYVYKDSGGLDTCAWGHLCTPAESKLYAKGMTQKQADDLLSKDVNYVASQVVKRANNPTQNEVNALVAFTYNVGVGALDKGTVMSKFNKGFKASAAATMKQYNKVNGNVIAGLTRRRKAEAFILLGGTIAGLDAVNWYE